MAGSFYTALDSAGDGGARFAATELTRGPWDLRHQHVGPPSALLGRAIEAFQPGDDLQVTRVTVDILGPVPIGAMEIRTEMLRPGKNVELVGAVCRVDGRDVLRAAAWRFRTAEVTFEPPAVPDAPDPAPPGPEAATPAPFPVRWEAGYHTAIDARFVHGRFDQPGPALAWLRMRVPLVAGESPSPLVRVLCAADSGNGISFPADHHRYLFINTELTVHLHRYPRGEWVGLASRTVVAPRGVGLTETDLFDTATAIGGARQSLFVRPRTDPDDR